MVREGEPYEYRELPISVEDRRKVVERAYDLILQEHGSQTFIVYHPEIGRVKCTMIPIDLNPGIEIQLTHCSGTTYTFNVFVPLNRTEDVNSRISPMIIKKQVVFSPDAYSNGNEIEAPPIIAPPEAKKKLSAKLGESMKYIHNLIHDLFVKNIHVL